MDENNSNGPQIVPHSREDEEAVVGSALIDPDAIKAVALSPTDFYIHRLGWIWGAMCNLSMNNKSVDFLTVTNELDKNGQLAGIGGPAYLTALINNTPSAMHIEDYANEVKDTSYRRRLIQTANKLAKIAYDESVPADVSEIVQGLEQGVPVEDGTVALRDVITDDYLKVVQARKDKIESEWEKFNAISGGIYKRQTVLFAGGEGVGKSVFVGQYGLHVAKQGMRVAFYLTEMDNEAQILRWVSSETKIPDSRIKENKLTVTERESIDNAFAYIKKLKIRITDSTRMSSAKIGADLIKSPADMVVVDSIGQLNETDEKKWDRVETSLLNLKRIAKNQNCAIISVATLVKDGSIRGTKEVSYICDFWYKILRVSEDTGSWGYWEREVFAGKQRHGGSSGYAKLKMHQFLPRLEEMN